MKRLDDPYYDVSPARATGYLERDGGDRIYWEDSGAEEGIPIVLIHGGPGGSNQPGYRRTCDPQRLRIIQFDQRGCGKSEPKGALAGNSLQATLSDMEALRDALGVDRWIVAGGSWGSTVALAYGEAYPSRTLGLMLISMWLCRARELKWWFEGVRTVFPELWHEFARHVPEAERADLKSAYCKRILGDDPGIADAFAARLYLYEEGFMRFTTPIQPAEAARGAAYGRIFAHYAAHDFFLEEDQLLRHAGAVGDMPVTLVTGRYDMCTPPDNAFDLAQRLPQAVLRLVAGAGHYPTEERLSLAILEESNALIDRVESRMAGRDA